MNLTYSNKKFTCDTHDVILEVDFIFNDTDANGIQFNESVDDYIFKDIYLKNVAENNSVVFYGKLAKKSGPAPRLGWIIPYSALISDLHDFHNNPHWANYAFIAYLWLIQQECVITRMIEGADFNSIVDEYADKDACLLIVNKSKLNDALTLDHFEIPLLEYGYSFYSAHEMKYQKTVSNNELKVIATKEMTDAEYSTPYVETFLKEKAWHDNELVRFLSLYQIIEILLDQVLISRLNELIVKTKNGEFNTRNIDTKLQNTTEASRFADICEWSGINKASYSNLKDECNNLLKKDDGKKKNYQIPECVYQTRNEILHRYRMVVKKETQIASINEKLFPFILDIMKNFQTKSF